MHPLTTRPLSLPVVSASLAFLGLGALYGGTALMLAPDGHLLGLPLDGLRTALFADYRVPGLLLFLLFGVGSLVSLFALWVRPWPGFTLPLPLLREHHWSWGAALTVGVAQVVWILAQLSMTTFRAPLQLLCGGAGGLIVACTLGHALRRASPRERTRT